MILKIGYRITTIILLTAGIVFLTGIILGTFPIIDFVYGQKVLEDLEKQEKGNQYYYDEYDKDGGIENRYYYLYNNDTIDELEYNDLRSKCINDQLQFRIDKSLDCTVHVLSEEFQQWLNKRDFCGASNNDICVLTPYNIR